MMGHPTFAKTLVLKDMFDSEWITQQKALFNKAPVFEQKNYCLQREINHAMCKELINQLKPHIGGCRVSYSYYLDQTLPYIVHTDGPVQNDVKAYYNIVIPLEVFGQSAHTVTFNQRFIGPGQAFVKGTSNDSLEVFGLTKNYSLVDGLSDQKFDEKILTDYLDHVDFDSLTGLSVENIIVWNPGDIILFDRYRLHCSSSFKKFDVQSKRSIVIATEID